MPSSREFITGIIVEENLRKPGTRAVVVGPTPPPEGFPGADWKFGDPVPDEYIYAVLIECDTVMMTSHNCFRVTSG